MAYLYPAAAPGSMVTGSFTVDFGTFPHKTAVEVDVVDAGVSSSSKIVLTVLPGTGRALDELELAPVIVSVGTITAGVGFRCLAVSDGCATGTYLVNYIRD